jgi:TPR repeat protein
MRRLCSTAVCLLTATLAIAEPRFDDGMYAYRSGDFAGAAGVWNALAEAGDARAQYHLGTLFALGRGVPQNDAEAAHWISLAGEQGHTLAQYVVGPMSGDNLLEARWYLQAAEQGHAVAQYNAGFLFDEGRGVERSRVRAHMWFSLAADRGFELAAPARDYCESHMNALELRKSRRLARKWATTNGPSTR